MKTPITDKLSLGLHEEENVSDLFAYIAMRSLARKLESDRAALMAALECAANFIEPEWRSVSASMREVIAAALANFPNED